MSTVLVTGAGGFVGRWLTKLLLSAGHSVIGASRPVEPDARGPLTPEESAAVEWVPLELLDPESVVSLAHRHFDAVVHLAALSSGAEARRDPGAAWVINAGGTARLLDELAKRKSAGEIDPQVVIASTGEVYGSQAVAPISEETPIAPVSPYAASKAGAELAARETASRSGLNVVIARPFQQTGPGQDDRFVVPALATRLLMAKRIGARVVKVGNLEPVRDFLDVRDVAAALVELATRSEPGTTFNIATGRGVPLWELFRLVSSTVGVEAVPEADPRLLRAADIPYLVGDPTKLTAATGWRAEIPLERTVQELVDSLPQ